MLLKGECVAALIEVLIVAQSRFQIDALHPGARGRPPRRTGHNLLLRLRDCKDDVLRFIADFDVPVTNNQAERDLRMMKLRMKISGGFRTLVGAEIFATMRSVISTTRKHGINIIRALTMPTGDLVDLLSA